MQDYTSKLKEYAHLLINFGLKVKEGYDVLIVAKAHSYKLVRYCVKEAYSAGAKKVSVAWFDDYVTHENFKNQDLGDIDYGYGELSKFVENYNGGDAAVLYLKSNNVEIFSDLNDEKRQKYSQWNDNLRLIVRPGNNIGYTIAAYPEPSLSKKIFPELSDEDAKNAHAEAIFKMQRINGDGKSSERWEQHFDDLLRRAQKLNDICFKNLHYKNSLGTDLTVELPEGHIWFTSTGNSTSRGNSFITNMPTEEIFTSPYRYGINGKVVFSKPMLYGGQEVKGAWLELKDGKVVDYGADEGSKAFTQIFDFCPNARYLGEAALVPYDSPISQMGRVFYDTLIDENASCHFALGDAYAKCYKGGMEMTEEDLLENGLNVAEVHIDFMIGTNDLSVVGTTQDGREVEIMKDGNFVI